MKKRTFAMIKPDAVACHYTGQIITLIEKAGFRIIAQKMLRLTTSDTNKFYAVHSQRPFFRNLSLFMTSGPVVVMVLEKENAIAEFRTLIGNTDHRLLLPAASEKFSDKVKPGMLFMARIATKMHSEKFIFSSAKGKSYRNLTVFLSLKQKSTVE